MFAFGDIILIVEPEVGEFVTALQKAVERKGAAAVVARDAATAVERCKQFRFTAALVNADYREVVDELPCAALLYSRAELPDDVGAKLDRLTIGR